MSLTMSMEHEHHHQEPGNAFPDANGQWPESSNVFHSHHQSPVHEYNGFAFAPMPMEPMYAASTMPPPRTTHQQLQPLIMPTWPSMLTSQSTYVPSLFPSAHVAGPAPPVSTPLSAPPATGRSTTTPRKTLTDADRRRMCLYAEEHPTVKQTEIGAMFGVERSTVSKVLRNKEKYLYQEDGSRSPVRKAKGKFPDIERALSNWAKNHQKQGLPLTDALIKEKFRFFATTVGSSESLPKANNNSWLEKFKQKNNLMGAKSRKSSVVEEAEAASNPGSGTHTPSNTSPTSPPPGKEASPAAMSVTKSEDPTKIESPDAYVDYSHKPYHSLSNASLASAFTDASQTDAFSTGPQSPTSPPFFSPDTSSPFIPPGQVRLPSANASNFQRPRSQTFPMLGVEPYVSPPSSEPLTPKYVSSTVLESPMTELSNPLATVEEAASGSSMHPPPPPHGAVSDAGITTAGISAPMLQTQATPTLSLSSPITPSSAISSVQPGSPTLEDTRRALEIVMSYLQQQPSGGLVEPKDLIVMGGLMERLKLQGSRQGSVSTGVGTPGGGEMPGGMHRIPSGEFKSMLARE